LNEEKRDDKEYQSLPPANPMGVSVIIHGQVNYHIYDWVWAVFGRKIKMARYLVQTV
jgi:hypothetical protein